MPVTATELLRGSPSEPLAQLQSDWAGPCASLRGPQLQPDLGMRRAPMSQAQGHAEAVRTIEGEGGHGCGGK